MASMVAVFLLCGLPGSAAGAAGQRDAAADQYGTTTTDTTPTPPPPPVAPAVEGVSTTATPTPTPTDQAAGDTSTDEADDTSGGTDTATDDNGKAVPGSGTPGAGGQGAGGQGTGGAFDDSATRVTYIQFGIARKKLQSEILRALTAAGLHIRFNGQLSRRELKRFLASDGSKTFGDGPRAIGRAIGAQLVSGSTDLRNIFNDLFGEDVEYAPVLRAVLTRRESLSDNEVAFQTGVAEGLRSTGIPLAYVEDSDTDPSHVGDYKKLGILTVSNMDELKGQQRLGDIMLGKIAPPEVPVSNRSAPITQADGSAGALPWALLALLVAGLAVPATAGLRRRSRRSA